ncbi:FtsX-like permease family protein [Thermocatellispora tengchongensis]|uniref:FtsX-like permease family protein n=1 Tax=Thermocatellispora tengchongensis TaxID=1073253 RepID=UPI00363FF1C4
MIVLGTAFGLATFGTAAWSVTSANYERVARTHNGADTVLRVGAMPLEEFREAVERADPSGSRAAPVLSVPGGQAAMLATDPARFARVAYWRPSFAGDQAGVPLSTLAGRLGREMAPRVLVTGDRFRVRIGSVRPPENWQPRLHADFRVPGHPRPVSIPLGLLDPARTVLEWGLPKDCRTAVCELRAIRGEVDFSPGATAAPDSRLDVPVRELAVRRDGRWRELDAGLTDPGRWRGPAEAGPKGLTLPMTPFGAVSAIPETFPEELPALVNGQLDGRYSQGADQAYLVKYDAVSTGPALPGLDRPGAIVDLELADRAAYAVDPKAEFQVWVAAGHGEAVRAALTRQGVPVFEPTRYTDLVARYTLQGPGLALFLLLLAAPAAAVLALGRAVLALYAAARRRSYELAALEAAGARPRALRAALLLEQLITLAAGMLAGVAAGLAAAAAALPRIPQFTATPLTPPLLYDPAPLPLVAVAVLALLAALAAAALTAELLLRRVRVDRLRESPA